MCSSDLSQSEYALAGGADYVATDVLADSQTEYLDDVSDGGSGIHTDFLGFVPDVLVDTHFVTRARLGRLAGALARLAEEGERPLGIGLDEQTCIVVQDDVATVRGLGSVSLLHPSEEAPVRTAGEPLIWSDLPLDRLVDGWSFTLPDGGATQSGHALTAVWTGTTTLADGDWEVNGATVADEARFAVTVDRSPLPYATAEGTEPPLLTDGVGILDAHDSDRRGANDEALFRALADHVGAVGYLVGDGGMIRREDDHLLVTRFGTDPLATMIVDTAGVTWTDLSPSPSPSDAGDSAAGLVGMRLHILYTDGDGRSWNPTSRRAE